MTYALERLFNTAKTDLEALVPGVLVRFGWREHTKHLQGSSAPRVDFRPGDTSMSLGKFAAAREPGRSPRPLFTIKEYFTVTVSSNDPTDPENELKQYVATRELFDSVINRLYRHAHGTFSLERANWNGPNERRMGAELVLIGVIDTPVFDDKLSDFALATPAITGEIVNAT